MTEELNRNEVVFLLGAGISIPIGIPAMEGIYKAFMTRSVSGISDENKKACQFLVSRMGVNPDLEEFLLATTKILEFRDSGLNQFVENSISKKRNTSKINDYNRNLSNNIGEIEDVRESILEFLSRMCFQFDRNKAEKINSGFVKTVSSRGYPVYSTNYDYSLEHVALENEVKIYDNFLRKGQRILWNEDIDFEGENGIRLIKLHGSVTWYEDSEGLVEKIYSSTDINPAGKPVGKIVIFPTRFKDIYSHNFFALYSHFLNSLAQSKVLIIAGHSLRDDYLRAAIIERKRKGNFQLIVIDPSYPIEIKTSLPPSKLGTLGETIHLPFRWEEIADELSSILRDYGPEELAVSCIDMLKMRKYRKNKIKIRGNIGVLKVGDTKSVSIDVKAYLNLNDKPSVLRAWLKATYSDESGTPREKYFTEFVNVSEHVYGNDLSGVVDASPIIEIRIPKVPKWIAAGCKVSLCVGMVHQSIKSPLKVGRRNIVAEDCKLLTYRE